jgi:hypothetical protein
MAKARNLDYTKVKDRGEFNRKHQAEGDYQGKILAVKTVRKKKEPHDEQWVFTVQVGTGTYPYYCGFSENELWKIRNLFLAAGINIPKKRFNTDPNKVVGAAIGVTLADDEYNDRVNSTIEAVFSAGDLDAVDGDEDDEEDDEGEDTSDDEEEEDEDDASDDDEEEEEEPAPPPKRRKKAAAPAAEDLDELDIEDV